MQNKKLQQKYHYIFAHLQDDQRVKVTKKQKSDLMRKR